MKLPALLFTALLLSTLGFTCLAQTFKLTSPDFQAGQAIPKTQACDGKGKSPALQITGTPIGAHSLALIMDDPDAPRLTAFVHWVMWNIPANTILISEGKVPNGAIQGNNSRNESHYTGPCPPSGTHHYHFVLYALDNKISLPAGASKNDLKAAMKGHILAQSELIGLYSAHAL